MPYSDETYQAGFDPAMRVPIIDFSSYAPREHRSQTELARAVDEALIECGFFRATNLGVDQALLQSVYAASKAFFTSSTADKNVSAYRSAAENFGYQGVGEENLDPNAPADLKETFTMRNLVNKPPEDGRWPSAEFRNLMVTFYQACFDSAFRLQRVLARSLDLDQEYFVRCHSGENVTLRLLYYPAGGPDEIQTGQLGAGAHTDYGLLTLLFQDDVGGLEVQSDAGDWHPVDYLDQAIVINSGDLLERWSNGRYRSTPHRVQPIVGQRERLSIAMFVDPDSDTQVEALPSCTCANNPPRFAPVTAGAHLQEKIEASHKQRFAK